VDSVGVPTLDIRLLSPTAVASQQFGPAGQLILFAKIYDVAPDSSITLVHRLVAPMRIADATKPVHVELPGVVHRYAAGHRLRVVVAASDASYQNNRSPETVSILTDPAQPGVLTLPVLSAGAAAAFSGGAGAQGGTPIFDARPVAPSLAATGGSAAAPIAAMAALGLAGVLHRRGGRRRQPTATIG